MMSSDSNMHAYWKIFVDGASRANPGLSGVGIYITKNNQTVWKLGFYTGIKTNNQAEYLALIIGLFFVKQQATSEDLILIVSDSELMVRQIKGEYRVKNEGLQPLFQLAKILLRGLQFNIAHVPREENSQADKLANLGIDQKNRLPDEIIAMLHEHSIVL